ncbi:MAG: hypothetical protein Q8Q20_05810, partial [bacterium]|nr:hypothetical protein [bacterium]
ISFSVSYGDEYNFATAKRGSVRIAGSSVVLSASAPRQVTSDEQFTVSTSIQNSGTETFPTSSINLELPGGFILLGSNIPDSDHDGWLVPELEPAAAWELSIRGNFPGLQEGNELFRFTHSVSISSGPVELESAEVSVQQVLPAPEESADVDDILNPDQPSLENLSLASDAVYTSHSGVELGFGPNPPRAGQRTGYRIIWAVGNPGQHVAGAKVEASLPFEVDWAGNGTVTHGSGIVYNSQSRLVTWTVGELEASDSSSSAGFDVIISPTQEDEGKTYLLLNQSTLTTTTTSVIAPGLSTDELVEP